MSYIPFISTSSRPIKRQKSHPGCKIAVSSHAPAKSFPLHPFVRSSKIRCIVSPMQMHSHILQNETQTFVLAYNKRNYRQKGAPRQTEKHWIIAAGRHRGIICGRDWVTTQSLLSNRHRAPGNPDAPKELLCSILYCHHCGSPMVSKRRSKNTDLPTYDYICSKKLRHGTALCSCQNLNGPQTDEDILQTLCSTLQKLLNINTPLDLDKLSQHKKRIFLTSFVKKILWDGTTLQLFLFF